MAYVESQDDQQRRHRLTVVTEQIANIVEMLPRLEAADARAMAPLPGVYGPRHTPGISFSEAKVARDNLVCLREEQVRHCRWLNLPVPPLPAEIGGGQ